MNQGTLLRQKLCDISNIIIEKYTEEPNIGVLTGVSGMAMFQFYYSKFLDIDENAEFGAEMISNCIQKINEGYSFPTYCTGIGGFGWAIQHLKTNGFIDFDCDDLLSQFDDYLYNQMMIDFDHNNFDFLHGALGYAYYFLSRYINTENSYLQEHYYEYLSKSVSSLEKLSIPTKNGFRWDSVLERKKDKRGANLGLSHGIPSILIFLSKLNKIAVFKDQTEKLLFGGVSYILGLKKETEKNISLFPSWVEKNKELEYNSRIAWCYGDLGIGLSLLQASQSLGDNTIENHSFNILSHTTFRKSPKKSFVIDAAICHGSYGNALIYQNLFHRNQSKLYKESMDYWIKDGIEKAIFNDGYAGYKQYNGHEKNWMPELSILEGVAGIGLTIINYLSKERNTWDECLMIS